MTEAACAHLTVTYWTTRLGGGAKTGRWLCLECLMEFRPVEKP